MNFKKNNIWAIYHENSKMRRYDREYGERTGFISSDFLIQKRLLNCFKKYQGIKIFNLPRVKQFAPRQLTFEKTIMERRTIREFSGQPLELEELSKLLYFGNGVTGRLTQQGELLRLVRAAPSGGALYPIEIYFVCFEVKNLDRGIYHYYARDHQLMLLKEGNYREKIRQSSFQDISFKTAAGVIILTAIFRRTVFKYGERGYRFILFEAGHVAQNISLTATANGFGSVLIGGFVDTEIEQLLEIDGYDESVLYLIAVGHSKQKKRS